MNSTDNNGRGLSPIRTSRLKKKRRRPKECALQTLPTTTTTKTTSPKQIRRRSATDVAGAVAVNRVDGNWKENSLNGLPPSSSLHVRNNGQNGEVTAGGKAKGPGTIAFLQRAGSPNQCGVEENNNSLKGCDTTTSTCRVIETNKNSVLGFMDFMEQSTLVSFIPSMLGIETTMRFESYSDFKRELERAFETKLNNNNNPRKDPDSTPPASKGIYHPLVGRIDFHNKNDLKEVDSSSIAFPRAKNGSSCQEFKTTPKENPKRCSILQHLNSNRQPEYGMRIPSSWYQFPMPKRQRSSLPESVATNNLQHNPQDDFAEPSNKNAEEQLSDTLRSSKNVSDGQNAKKDSEMRNQSDAAAVSRNDNDKQFTQRNERDGSCSHETRKLPSPPPSSLKYQGKIRIVSNKGATIREMCDIDHSDYAIGKLSMGNERYFLEKRILPPPPISLVDEDDSDGESEDECVAVVRYKIVLKSSDCTAGMEDFVERSPGKMVGWISDRGRLAEEPYLIL
eukprot:CAMPEP_0183731540 /NCGR_PEP_ID=MMETSP0737-20130205/35690_1 /TAXON_ID=385413 /ORGANISM="Thalassiosira miniscula, Strain CCMP1093" /LENGTH=506 /DNA_ID=CAMNT_0025964289 /DNA_START=6 /DNA_END=1523 /DNA_ORIENTATION=+